MSRKGEVLRSGAYCPSPHFNVIQGLTLNCVCIGFLVLDVGIDGGFCQPMMEWIHQHDHWCNPSQKSINKNAYTSNL